MKAPLMKLTVPRGFTLVELLVVVSIIALLISILLPSLSKAREQAKVVKCLAHQRGLGQTGLVFSQDHQGRFQLATNSTGVDKADKARTKFEYTSARELFAWPVALARSAKIDFRENWQWGRRADMGNLTQALSLRGNAPEEFDLPTCPADKVGFATPFYPVGTGNGMLAGPGDPELPVAAAPNIGYWGRLSFGINEDLVGSEVNTSVPPAVGRYIKDGSGNSFFARGEQHPSAGERLQGNLDRAYEPSSILLLVDSGPNDEADFLGGQVSVVNRSGLANLITSAKATGPLLEDAVWQWPRRIPTKRHIGGRINVAFGDFHGETVTPAEWRQNTFGGQKVPTKFSTKVRVSPYKPFPD